jgi:hypothetical protein
MKMNFGNKNGYLDPGTGNALIAALFGILGSIAYFAKNLFYRLTGKKQDIFKSDLAIFSEGKMYWIYFKDVVEELIRRKVKFTYYTMDMKDPALRLHDFSNKDENFSLFKVKFAGTGSKGYSAISNLKEKNILATTPNIGSSGYPIKKPKKCENLIHIFHSPRGASAYKKHSLDCYDTIFSHGAAFTEEIKILEGKRSLPAKAIIDGGLVYMDSMIEKAKTLQNQTDGKTILVASTWNKRGCLQIYGSKFIKDLSNAGYNVIVRPHPYSYIHEKEFMENLQRELPDIVFSREIDGLSVLAKADILISDISGIRLDFYLCFNRPVISLESDIGLSNEYEQADLPKNFDIEISGGIGIYVKKEEIENLPQIVKNIGQAKLIDKNAILSNIGKSKLILADYLESITRQGG